MRGNNVILQADVYKSTAIKLRTTRAITIARAWLAVNFYGNTSADKQGGGLDGRDNTPLTDRKLCRLHCVNTLTE